MPHAFTDIHSPILFLEQGFGSLTLLQWVAFLLLTLVLAGAIKWAIVLALRVAGRLARRSATDLDDIVVTALSRVSWLFVLALSFVVTTHGLEMGNEGRARLMRILIAAFLYQGGVFAARLLQGLIERQQKLRLAKDPAAATGLSALRAVGRLAIWIVVVLAILGNFGVNITALIAGLGVGGVAVALAVQNILGDLFASFTIILDKPFEVGDFIIVGEHLGSVEKVGLKTTRVRSLSGEQLVFANGDLLQSRIRNYKRMYERRVLFGFGVLYSTPPEVLSEIGGVVKEIVSAQNDVRFDRAHFKGFGPSSLDFEVVYFVLKPDYTFYMDTQQAINLALMRALAARGVEFAFPTQTVHIDSAPQSPIRLLLTPPS